MNLSKVLFELCFAIACISYCDALRFHLCINCRKCFKEEIHKNILVTGAYDLSVATNQKTDLSVTDSKGHVLFRKDDAASGKFAFTTEDNDVFEICFQNQRIGGSKTGEREVYLDVKRGVEAKNYGDLADAEKLKPLEVELKRLEDLTQAIVNDFDYAKAREEEMRDTNESTHARVTYFSIVSIICLLSLAAWQTLYFQRYFKSKKLID